VKNRFVTCMLVAAIAIFASISAISTAVSQNVKTAQPAGSKTEPKKDGNAKKTAETLPKPELLWTGAMPDAKGDATEFKPMFTSFTLDAKDPKNTGAAVVVCPGGGYQNVAIDHEGWQIARWFNAQGVSAFVLDYRHRGRGYGHPAPMHDAQRAVRTVRARAAEWGIAPNKIGIMGFSAGGHLASTVGTHFDAGKPDASDPIERASCRPDFMVLCYPVIVFQSPCSHVGSQQNLLGKDAPKNLIESLSNEKQVTPQTPPTFLFTTDEDKVVPPENSVLFYLALHRANVPAELHVFQTGRHGLGLAQKTPGTSAWPELLKAWMQTRKLLEK
jgi:acetyl esterase/lipase